MSRTQPVLIAHVLYRFAVGGLENGVVNLINRLPPERWRHAVIALTDVCGRFRERVERSDVEFIELHKGAGHLIRHYPRVVRLLKRLRPAIVHTRNLAALEAAIPAWAAGVPVRIHGEHGWDMSDPYGDNARYQRMRRVYTRFATHYVALSKDIEAYLQHRIGLPAGRIAQIYNGVDTQRYRPHDGVRPWPDGVPFSRDAWLVGTVGRLDAVKDQPSLVRAFVAATRASPEAARRLRLVIVGEGPARPEIVRALEAGGVAQRAWLAGERADVPQIMRSLDCFVLPSRSEGISNTVLEAMASGLPVVATRVGGNGELIEDAVSGTLVPAQDEAGLAAAMLAYFHDPAKAQRHAGAARRRAEQHFGLERMVADYDRLYAAAIAARFPAGRVAQRRLAQAGDGAQD